MTPAAFPIERTPTAIYATLPDSCRVSRRLVDDGPVYSFRDGAEHPVESRTPYRLRVALAEHGYSEDYACLAERAACAIREAVGGPQDAPRSSPVACLRKLLALIRHGDLVVDPTNRDATEADIREAEACLAAIDPE